MKRIFLVLVAGAFAGAAAAQQYKWVDKNGKVQYGDTPPAGTKATPLKPPPGPAAPAAAPAAAGKGEKAMTPEQAFQKRQKDKQEADQKAEKERQDAEVKRANCETAQSRLRQMQSGERVSTSSKDGERAFLDDAGRARETERAQKAVAEWCK